MCMHSSHEIICYCRLAVCIYQSVGDIEWSDNASIINWSIYCNPVTSWSAVASLGAVTRDAKYLKHGEEIYIPPGMLMDHSNVQEINFLPGFNLEGYFNRDSTQYVFAYGIPTAHTVQRGTLRYKVCEEILVTDPCPQCTSTCHGMLCQCWDRGKEKSASFKTFLCDMGVVLKHLHIFPGISIYN